MVVQLESTPRAWIIIIMMSRQEFLAVVLSLAVIAHHNVSYVLAQPKTVGTRLSFPPPHN